MNRDNGAPCMTDQATGMALSVLAEVGRLLESLAENGQAGSIDLRSLPLTDADREQLEELLGRGEVRAELDLAGSSEVWETAYPGAWWIRHRGAGDKISSEEIAVCRIPDILITHPVDIEAAARRIRQELSPDPDGGLERDAESGGRSETELEASHV
jgi:hydrogenase-1 operon protein HyaF